MRSPTSASGTENVSGSGTGSSLRWCGNAPTRRRARAHRPRATGTAAASWRTAHQPRVARPRRRSRPPRCAGWWAAGSASGLGIKGRREAVDTRGDDPARSSAGDATHQSRGFHATPESGSRPRPRGHVRPADGIAPRGRRSPDVADDRAEPADDRADHGAGADPLDHRGAPHDRARVAQGRRLADRRVRGRPVLPQGEGVRRHAHLHRQPRRTTSRPRSTACARRTRTHKTSCRGPTHSERRSR